MYKLAKNVTYRGLIGWYVKKLQIQRLLAYRKANWTYRYIIKNLYFGIQNNKLKFKLGL